VAASIVVYASGNDEASPFRVVPVRRGVIQSELSEPLADSRIILLGETPHFAVEIERLTYEVIVPDLFDSGFRLFVAEENHAFGWIFDMYAAGTITRAQLPAGTYSYYQRTYDTIRKLNGTVPTSDRLHVRTVDVNHYPWAFRVAIEYASNWLGDLSLFQHALDMQFGGELETALPPFESGKEVASHQRRLYPLEASHGARYREELLRVLDVLDENELSYRNTWGDEWYERIVRITEVEHASSQYRETQDASSREDTIHELISESVNLLDLRAIAHLGSRHAQKAQTALFGHRSFASAGERLRDEYATFHLILYALSGERLNHLQADAPVEFEQCHSYPPENLLSIICASDSPVNLWLLEPATATAFQWFGTAPVVPDEVWDALVTFRAVTVRDEFR